MKQETNVTLKEMDHRKFEVQRRNYRLALGEKVTPETVIGKDCRTRENLKAGCYGQVATAYFNPMHDSLMVMIIETKPEIANGSRI